MESYFENTETDDSVLEALRKRKYNARMDRSDRDAYFGKTKHNLLQDLGETPTKIVRLTSESHHGSATRSAKFSAKAPSVLDYEATKKDLAQKEAELIAQKASYIQLENKLKSAETAARQAQIEHDRELGNLRAEKEKECTKSLEMRSKLQYVMEKERTAREELSSVEEELGRQKVNMDKKILAIQRQMLETEDRSNQLKEEWLERESEMRKQNMRQMREISSLESRLEETEAQLALRMSVQGEYNEKEEEIKELKTQLKGEQDKIKDLQQQLLDHEDNIMATKALKADLDLVPSMKNEIEKLKMSNEQLRHNEQNTMLLEEEIRSLKTKLENTEKRLEHVIELEVTNEELQGRLQRWEAKDTSGSRRPQSPSSLSRRVAELEIIQASAALKQGEIQSSLNSANMKLEQASSQICKLNGELATEKSQNAQNGDRLKRLKRKLLLVTKERDSYKGIIDSYESEATVNIDARNRSQGLEEMLQGYRNQVEETEAEINSLTDKLSDSQKKYEQVQQQLQILSSSESSGSSRQDQDTIQQLRERVIELEESLMKTQEEKDILEARIEQRCLQGDFDPSKTKVLQLTLNPCAIAQKARQEELDKIREENDKLKKRNAILEEHGGNVRDLTMQVVEQMQHPSPSKEVEDVKAQLKREEMRNQRLMEVFKKTSHEFREICYQLTGFKIDIQCPNQYKLTSMYSESPRDFLLFQQNEQGEIQMLQTDFSNSVQEAIQMYLQQQNSIPMFLCSITQDLFSKQTMNLG